MCLVFTSERRKNKKKPRIFLLFLAMKICLGLLGVEPQVLLVALVDVVHQDLPATVAVPENEIT